MAKILQTYLLVIFLANSALSDPYDLFVKSYFIPNLTTKSWHQPSPQLDNSNPLLQARDDDRDQIVTEKPVKAFMLLTTGSQIKLYPLVGDNPSPIQNYFYLIQERPFDKKRLDQLDDSAFKRWQLTRSEETRQSQQQEPRQASILPTFDRLYEANSSSDWQRPWITDVDYLVDDISCGDPFDSVCFSVIWLDRRNKLIRYGSVEITDKSLITVKQYKSDTRSNGKNQIRTLLLDELPPIDVCQLNESDAGYQECQVYAMTLDKRENRVYVAVRYGEDRHTSGPNKIVSAKLKLSQPSYTEIDVNEDLLEIFSFEDCHYPLQNSVSSFENLFLDLHSRPRWLYYLNRQNGGKLSAIHMIEANRADSVVPVALIRDLSADTQSSSTKVPTSRLIKPNVMTYDTVNRRFIWLNDENELYSCDHVGQNVRFIAKLSPKPVIRSPNTMKFFNDSLYLSDSSKKSLIVYRLNDSNTSETSSSELQTHQVLMVETPGIYGFQIFEAQTLHRTKRYSGELYKFNWDAYEEEEFRILIDRTGERMQCAPERFFKDENDPKGERLFSFASIFHHEGKSRHDNLISLVIELAVVQTFFLLILWLAYPWIKNRITPSANFFNMENGPVEIKCPV